MSKICPLMSSSDRKVKCTENCKWYIADEVDECIVEDIARSLLELSKMQNED